MKKYFGYLIILFLVVGCAKGDINYYTLENAEEYKYTFNELINLQNSTDEKINEYLEKGKKGLQNALVICNPYSLVPYSAVIVFKTEKKSSGTLTINDKLVSTFEDKSEYIIPIYGLIEDYTNVVSIELSDGESRNFKFKTEKTYYKPLNIEKKWDSQDSYLLLSNDYGMEMPIYDNDGNLVWFFNSNFYAVLEKMSNGHLMSVIADKSYHYYVEIDYLGKIYKSYRIEAGTHHLQYVYEDKLLILSYESMDENLGCKIIVASREDGKKIYELKLNDIIKKYDHNLYNTLKNKFDWAHVNSAQIIGNELLISSRGTSTIFSINMDNNEINYMINTNNFWTKNFAEFLIDTNGVKLNGQHDIRSISKNTYSLFNNNYEDPLTGGKDISNAESYSYPLVIKNENGKMKVLWDYKGAKLFAAAYSSINYSEENKLINYSNLRTQRNTEYNELYEDFFTKFIEIDKNGNVIFSATKENCSSLLIQKINIYENYKFLDTSNKVAEFIVD